MVDIKKLWLEYKVNEKSISTHEMGRRWRIDDKLNKKYVVRPYTARGDKFYNSNMKDKSLEELGAYKFKHAKTFGPSEVQITKKCT